MAKRKTKKKSAKSVKKVKKPAKRKAAKRAASNRRKFRRYSTPNLWVTEFSGDFQFLLPVSNLSEGGIFLRTRVRTTSDSSQIRIPLGEEMLEVTASPIYDMIKSDSCGTGYRFIDLSPVESKKLRSFLRNLD